MFPAYNGIQDQSCLCMHADREGAPALKRLSS